MTTTATKSRLNGALNVGLSRAKIETIEVPIVGTSQLVSHAWSPKAKKMILDKQLKKTRGTAREAKNPEQDFVDSLYKISDDDYGFPAVAFKAALVSACRFVDDLKMTQVRGLVFVVPDEGELVRINGTPTPREDMVRVGMGTADIRYRGEYINWSATLKVRYMPDNLSLEQLIHLIELAGQCIGVGEWRPEKGGVWGMFRVASEHR